MAVATETKRCYKCAETKPLDAFHANRSEKDGKQKVCKGCRKTPRHPDAARIQHEHTIAAVREIGDLDGLIAKVGLRRVVTDSGCWEFTGGKSVKGYPSLSVGYIPELKRGNYVKLHRLALALSHGLDYYGDWTTLDTCPAGDNKGCWNPDHLRPGTNADNLRDAMHRGQRNGALLLADRHHDIVRMIESGTGTVEIAATIGCSPSSISNYKRRHGLGRRSYRRGD